MNTLPEITQGLKLYIEYAKKQIKLNEALNKRLLKNIEQCQELLELKGDK